MKLKRNNNGSSGFSLETFCLFLFEVVQSSVKLLTVVTNNMRPTAFK